MKNEKYHIGIVHVDELGSNRLYTVNLYKRILGLFWWPIFCASSTSASCARDICRKELLRIEALDAERQ